jgi:hypothetical protein
VPQLVGRDGLSDFFFIHQAVRHPGGEAGATRATFSKIFQNKVLTTQWFFAEFHSAGDQRNQQASVLSLVRFVGHILAGE